MAFNLEPKPGRFGVSFDHDDEWATLHAVTETEAEAIEAAQSMPLLDEYDPSKYGDPCRVVIWEILPWFVPVNGWLFIDDIEDRWAEDERSGGAEDLILNKRYRDHLDELERDVEAAALAWMQRHNLLPAWHPKHAVKSFTVEASVRQTEGGEG